jgi:hypothetical protein
MLSTISFEIKKPSAKIALFLAFHMAQIEECQIKTKPLRILEFLPDPLNISKREGSDGGIIISTPTHLKISPHTIITLGQCKKRWLEVSTLPTQPTHSQGTFKDKIPRTSKLSLEGIRSRISCQENAITLEGAALFQIWPSTTFNSSSTSASLPNPFERSL